MMQFAGREQFVVRCLVQHGLRKRELHEANEPNSKQPGQPVINRQRNADGCAYEQPVTANGDQAPKGVSLNEILGGRRRV